MEFWRSQNPGDIAIRITPGEKGVLQVFLDGQKIFDRREDPGGYPDLPRVNQLKMVIADKIEDIDTSTAAGNSD